MKKNLKTPLKKSTAFALTLYVLLSVIVSVIFILLESWVGLAIMKYTDVSLLLEKTGFVIASNIIIAFLSVFIFVKIFKNKYILEDSKEKFLYRFLMMIIIFFTISFSINTINGSNKLYTQLNALLNKQTNLGE